MRMSTRDKVITAQLLRAATRDGDPNITMFRPPAGSDMPIKGAKEGSNVIAAIHNLDPPYTGAVILFRLVCPDNYPSSPPHIECLTPNGVYDLGGKICISIGEFHAKTKPGPTGSFGWRKGLGLLGFTRALISGFACPECLGNGIRIIKMMSEKGRAELAAKSVEYNAKHNPTLAAAFAEALAENPDHPAARLHAKWAATEELISALAGGGGGGGDAIAGDPFTAAAHGDGVDPTALRALAAAPARREGLLAYLRERHPTRRRLLAQELTGAP